MLQQRYRKTRTLQQMHKIASFSRRGYVFHTNTQTLPGLSVNNCEIIIKPGNCRCLFRRPLSPGIPSRSECRCISTKPQAASYWSVFTFCSKPPSTEAEL